MITPHLIPMRRLAAACLLCVSVTAISAQDTFDSIAITSGPHADQIEARYVTRRSTPIRAAK